MKGITVRIDAELHAEIKAYLEQNEMTMGEFIAMAAQEVLQPPSMTLDPELQSEVEAYLDEHGMAMDEFIAQAAQDKLHPKTSEVEVKEMGNLRTLAFQVPESLFQRVKQYLERNNMTQKAFVIGLIEDELDRDEELLRKQTEQEQDDEEEEQDEGLSEAGEAPVGEVSPEDEYGDEPEEAPDVSDSEGSFEPEDEEETDGDYEEIEDGEFPEEAGQDRPYIEGAAAAEVAPDFDYQEDEQPGFPEPEDDEEQEFGEMSM